MDVLDPAFLARLQFAVAALAHLLFLSLSAGLALPVAIFATGAARAGEDARGRQCAFFAKLLAASFACALATGAVLLFSVGTNWAGLVRTAGAVLGAPLVVAVLVALFPAAACCAALVFGRGRIGRGACALCAWVLWAALLLYTACIAAVFAWMHAPTGYALDVSAGTLRLTDAGAAFLTPAAFALFACAALAFTAVGALVVAGAASVQRLHARGGAFATRAMRLGAVVAAVSLVLTAPAAHLLARTTAEQQPAAFAAMHGHYDTGSADEVLVGYVGTTAHTAHGPSIPGLASFLAYADFGAACPGLDELEAAAPGSTPGRLMVQVSFVAARVALVAALLCVAALVVALVAAFSRKGGPRWALRVVRRAWIAPLAAVVGAAVAFACSRQPWTVYGVLKTADACSPSLSAAQALVVAFFLLVLCALVCAVAAGRFSKAVNEGAGLREEAGPRAHGPLQGEEGR